MGHTKILGISQATAGQMAAYLLSVNPAPRIDMTVRDFCQLFLDTATREGVRGDALFAQSCKETGNFKFRGTVQPEQHNFAGLGTTDPNTPGASFADAATGILAQAQHAKAYATNEPLSCSCVDPRYSLLVKCGKAGTAEYWEELGGKWAVPGYDTKKYKSLQEADIYEDSYGYQIIKILDKILETKEDVSVAKNPIIALDAGHGMKTAGKRCLKSLDPNETREWWLNDRITDKVETALAAYDCTVLRVDDTTGAKDVSLAARVNAANSAKADIYVSIHHNAGLGGRTGGGTVVYYSTNKTAQKGKAQRLYDAVVAKTGLKGNRSQKTIEKGFYVIKNTTMPAFLIENGFMDSPTDVPIILSEAHAEKTAQGVLDFLVSELSLHKIGHQKPQTSPVPEAGPKDVLPHVTVEKGDTLTKIGRELGVDWHDIAAANDLKRPYTIHVGQKLYIPSKESAQLYYPAYTGKKTTLTAAMTSLGIASSYSDRNQIAAANGISGYCGTASQNIQMYNLLVAGLLKKM